MKDNFDDYINRKLNQRQFEFDEDNWLKAAQLLDQEDEHKKRGFFWLRWASAILLLLTAVSLGYYYTNNNGLSPKTVTLNEEKVNPSHKNENSNHKNEFLDETLTKNETKTDFNSSRSIENSSKSTFSTTPTKQPTFKNKHFALIEKPTLTDYNTASGYTRKNPVLLPKTQTKDFVLNKSILIGTINNRLKLIDIPEMELLANYLDESVLKHNPKISAHPNALQFAMRAGILGSQKPFKNMSYSGGIVISYPISKKWMINLEGDYASQFHELNIVKKARRITYSFGKTIFDDALTPNRLHFIEIPLYLSYRFGRNPYKYQVNFGASVSKLIQVDGSVVSTVNGESAIVSTGKITTNLYNSTFINGLMGFEYKLTKRINLGLRATYNFSNLINENINNELPQIEPSNKTRFELNTKIRLY